MLSVMSGITNAFTSTRKPGSSWEDRVFLSTLPLAVARSIGGPPVVQAARSALDRLAPPTRYSLVPLSSIHGPLAAAAVPTSGWR
eukprot:8567050-Heterocapsa_arctica.AAC.1